MVAAPFVLDRDGLDGYFWDEQAAGIASSLAIIGASGAATRPGVIPALGNPLGYVHKTGLTGTLKAGRCWVSSSNVGRGGFPVMLPADVDFVHTTASSSAVRIDLIIAEVQSVGTTASVEQVRVVEGTAGQGTPAVPVVGNGGYLVLATVTVGVNVVSISGGITDSRVYTGSANVVVETDAAAAALPDGTVYYNRGIQRVGFVRGAARSYLNPEDATWKSGQKKVTVSQAGIADTAYTAIAASSGSFLMGGGQTYIRAVLDVEVLSVGSLMVRLTDDLESEATIFDVANTPRQAIQITSMRYCPPGVLTLGIAGKKFSTTPGTYWNFNNVTYYVYSQGLVTP